MSPTLCQLQTGPSFLSRRAAPIVLLLAALSACGKTASDGRSTTDDGPGGALADGGVPPSASAAGSAQASSTTTVGAATTTATGTAGTTAPGTTGPIMGGSTPVAPGTVTAAPTTSPPIMTPSKPGITSSPIQPPPPVTINPTRPEPGACQDAVVTEGSGYCQSSVSCSNNYFYASCSAEGATSYCSCGDNYGNQNFTIAGASAGLCGKVMDVCKSGAAIPTTGNAMCTTVSGSASTSYCDMSRQCTRTADLGGSSAVLTDNQYTSCQASSSGGFDCSCSTSNSNRSYHIANSSASSSCTASLDACGSATAPEFNDPPSCATTQRTEYTGGCQVQVQCTYSEPVSDGVTALAADYNNVYCNEGTAGAPWSCSCNNSTTNLSFEVANSQGSGVCNDLSAACQAVDVSSLTGTPSCERSYQSVNSGTCNATLSCRQKSTFADREVNLYGSINTYCQVNTDTGAWDCQCANGAESESLSVEANDGWEACEKSAAKCPDLVPAISSNNGFGGGKGGPIPISSGVPIPL